MLKFKAPLKKLSAAVALGLLAGTASASVSVSIYNTFPFGYSLGEALMASSPVDGKPEWAAGRFTVDPVKCPNGCSLDSVRLSLASGTHFIGESVPLKDSSGNDGISLAVYSNNFAGGNTHIPGDKLFDLSIPDRFVQEEHHGGNDVWFAAPSQNLNEAALLQPHTAYWLHLTNKSLSFPLEWSYNGVDHAGQYFAAYHRPTGGHGSPYLFEVMATSCTTCLAAPVSAIPVPGAPAPIPVPGAIWLMGTGLIGLLASGRREFSGLS